MRASFFLVFAHDDLTNLPSKNPSGYFILSELPVYLFFSIFVFLIIFWVIFFFFFFFFYIFFLKSRVSRSTSHKFMSKVLRPVITLNVFLYTFFIIVCIVAATVTGKGANTLNKVYKIFVSVISLLVVIGCWIFGGIVLKGFF